MTIGLCCFHAPTVHPPCRCREWRSCVSLSRHGNGRSACAEVNRRRCLGALVCANDSPIAQHSVVGHSPSTSHRRCQESHKCVPPRYRNSCSIRSEVNRLRKGIASQLLPPSPTCPALSRPPTLQITVVENGAGVGGSPADTATAVRPDRGQSPWLKVRSSLSFAMMVPPSPNCPRDRAPTLQIAVVKDGANMYVIRQTPQQAVRPVPRINVAFGGVSCYPRCPTIAQLSIVVPSPQHFNSPLSRMAQVCLCSSRHCDGSVPVPRLIAKDEGA